MADEPMSDEQLEALRQALDDAVLMHTGRSIGDIASGQVARDVVGTLHAWLQQQLEKIPLRRHMGHHPHANQSTNTLTNRLPTRVRLRGCSVYLDLGALGRV